MHELGWHGPQMLRFNKKTLNGYWRPPTVGGVFSPDLDDTDRFASDALAAGPPQDDIFDLPALAEVRKCLAAPARDLPARDEPDNNAPAPAPIEAGCVDGNAVAPAPSEAPQESLATQVAPMELLPRKLERVTLLRLEKLEQLLCIPTNHADGNLLRAQTTAAGIAMNAQLRADEQRLKTKVQGDVLDC